MTGRTALSRWVRPAFWRKFNPLPEAGNVISFLAIVGRDVYLSKLSMSSMAAGLIQPKRLSKAPNASTVQRRIKSISRQRRAHTHHASRQSLAALRQRAGS